MNKLKVLIVAEDRDYGHILALSMANRNADFDVTLESTEKWGSRDPVKSMEYSDRFDILLMDEEITYTVPGIGLDSAKLVRLCPEKELAARKAKGIPGIYELGLHGENNRDGPGGAGLREDVVNDVTTGHAYVVPCICKYTDVEEMSAALRYFHGIRSGEAPIMPGTAETRMVLVTSGSGGVGTTSVAVTLSRLISQIKKYQVLYLNYEEVSSTNIYFNKPKNGKKDINEYIYHLFKGTKPQSYIESFTFKDAYDVAAFYPSVGRNQLKTLTRQELEVFISSLTEIKIFDCIIIDSGSELSECGQYLLDCCEKIVLLNAATPVSREKNNRWMDEYTFLSGKEAAEEIIRVENMSEANAPRSLLFDENSFSSSDEYIEIAATNAFAVCVRSLMEEVCGYG